MKSEKGGKSGQASLILYVHYENGLYSIATELSPVAAEATVESETDRPGAEEPSARGAGAAQ